MNLKKISVTTLILASASLALAAYDKAWYITEYWSGEYPNGFSVIQENTTVPARSEMDLDKPANIQCAVPFKAVFHPWNEARKANYMTASRIVNMTAKIDFELEGNNEEKVKVHKGDTVEYLIYGAEGGFTVRYQGVEYYGDQELFEKIEESQDSLDFHQDEWVHLTCGNGENAWIFMPDLSQTDEQGEVKTLPGIGSWGLGMRDYGQVTDLTDDDLKKSQE